MFGLLLQLSVELGLLRFVRFEVPLLPASGSRYGAWLPSLKLTLRVSSGTPCWPPLTGGLGHSAAGLMRLWTELFRQPASRVGPKCFNESRRKYDVCCRNPGLKETSGNHVVCESGTVMLCGHMYQRSFRIGNKSYVPFIALCCFCTTPLKTKSWVRKYSSSGRDPRVVWEDWAAPWLVRLPYQGALFPLFHLYLI